MAMAWYNKIKVRKKILYTMHYMEITYIMAFKQCINLNWKCGSHGAL